MGMCNGCFSVLNMNLITFNADVYDDIRAKKCAKTQFISSLFRFSSVDPNKSCPRMMSPRPDGFAEL